MKALLSEIRTACEQYGINYQHGFFKDYNEYYQAGAKFPMLWVLPVTMSPVLEDNNPSPYMTYQISGFLINNENRENIKDSDFIESEDLILKVIKYLDYNNDDWDITNMEFEPMPENFNDRSYGLRIQFNISKYIHVVC